MPDKDIIPVVNSTTSPQVCCKIDDSNTYKRAVSRNDQWISPSSTDWNVIPTSFSDARALYSFIQSGKKPSGLFHSTSSVLSLALASSMLSASFIYLAAFDTFTSPKPQDREAPESLAPGSEWLKTFTPLGHF